MGVACLEFHGKNFRGWLKNCKIRGKFSPLKVSRYTVNFFPHEIPATCTWYSTSPLTLVSSDDFMISIFTLDKGDLYLLHCLSCGVTSSIRNINNGAHVMLGQEQHGSITMYRVEAWKDQ